MTDLLPSQEMMKTPIEQKILSNIFLRWGWGVAIVFDVIVFVMAVFFVIVFYDVVLIFIVSLLNEFCQDYLKVGGKLPTNLYSQQMHWSELQGGR